MSRKRRKFSATFKAKVALEAAKGALEEALFAGKPGVFNTEAAEPRLRRILISQKTVVYAAKGIADEVLLFMLLIG